MTEREKSPLTDRPVSRAIEELSGAVSWFTQFFLSVTAKRDAAGPEISDFIAGDPQEPALPDYVAALQRAAAPRGGDPRWFAYTRSDPEAQAAAAAGLRERLGMAFRPQDILMTNAAIAGLAVTFRAILDPGDEVIIVSPPHFLYEPIILAAGGRAVRARMREEDFNLDVDAIGAAVTERTRAIVVNSPHNPTGRIYPPQTLERLAAVLQEASARNGRRVYLLSDEAYSRIVFDGREFRSPTEFYPLSFLIYTYGKQLLAPGQRIGYVAMAPDMPDKDRLLAAIMTAQITGGWAFPNALLQHGLADLERISIDVGHLQSKRDRMAAALRDMGFELHTPEATFYLLVRSPIADDTNFTERLADRGVFVMPGSLLEAPGSFRISLTASDEMIDRSLAHFAEALSEAAEGEAPTRAGTGSIR